MNRTRKLLIVLLCASICAGGVILSQKEKAQGNQSKTKVLPINNRAKNRIIWIWS